MKNLSLFALLLTGTVASYAQTVGDKTKFQIIDQWDRVNIANFESETKGFTKIDLVTVKSTGTTILSSASRVHNRAVRKLKIATALLGGTLVYLKDETLVGNGFSNLGMPRTQLFGTVYATPWSDTASVIKQLKETREYVMVTKIGMRNNDAKIHFFDAKLQPVIVDSYTIRDNFVYLKLSANKGKEKWVPLPEKNVNKDQVRVLGLIEGGLLLSYKEGTAIYNVRIVKK
ncbi:MAG: hypothetical protein JSS79_05830 [Bacteroidetes bacterium]|nr:hypothetical protein [Bacteroidota bacterium]